MHPLSKRTGFALLSVFAAVLAVFSLRYLLPGRPATPLNVGRNAFLWPWLPLHAGLSAIALVLGPFQFLPGPRGRRHRVCGRLYILCCLLSAPAGLLLAVGVSTGPVAVAGFGSLAIIWFAVTGLGFGAALDRRWTEHRQWMIRSYALTFGAVTLRVYLAIAIAARIDFDTAYRVISFLAWVPNLLVVEWVMRSPTSPRRALPRP